MDADQKICYRHDYHMHTAYGDGEDSVDAMVAAAKESGCSEIAITEHLSPFFAGLSGQAGRKIGGMTMMPEDAEIYLDEISAAEQRYQLQVLKGFELTYFEFDEDPSRRLIERLKPDILLLAVHNLELLLGWERPGKGGNPGRVDSKGHSVYLGGDSLDELERQYGGIKNLCAAYFRRLHDAVDFGAGLGGEGICSDVGIAHLVVFEHHPQFNMWIPPSLIDYAVGHIAKSGLALEVNFAKMGKGGCTQPRPSFEAAARYLSKGGRRLQFASDAHSVEDLKRASVHFPMFQEFFKGVEAPLEIK
ncbi:PHP domain-containing protein [Candidatus Woesearchaeota archaeon]|nr:PHP domain-containing protein [Candidatus Woesearchaeota archaeon]